MRYLKSNAALIADRFNIRICQSLPNSGTNNEIILVENVGFYQRVNNSWEEIMNFTIGSGLIGEIIISLDGNLADTSYLYCDGSAFDITEYPKLYALLGDNHLPDLREAHLVGVGQNTTDNIATHDVFTLGETKDRQIQGHKHGFSETNHNHGINLTVSDNHTHSVTGAGTVTHKTINAAAQWHYKTTENLYTTYTSWSMGMGDPSWTSTPSVSNPSDAANGEHLRTKALGVKYYIKAK